MLVERQKGGVDTPTCRWVCGIAMRRRYSYRQQIFIPPLRGITRVPSWRWSRSSPRRSGPVGAGPFVISRAIHARPGLSRRHPPPSGRDERSSAWTSAAELQRLGVERDGKARAADDGSSQRYARWARDHIAGQPSHAQDPTECGRALLLWGARSTLLSRSWHPSRHLRQRVELGLCFIEGRPLERSPFRLFGPCPKSQTATSSLPCPSEM